MALTLSRKLQKTAALIFGIRKPRIAEKLAPYGFTDEEAAEGAALLTALLLQKYPSKIGGTRAPEPDLLEKLDAWENEFFPLADSSLKRRTPRAHAYLFDGLTQTEGLAVIASVSTFVRRYRELENGASGLGDEAKLALEILTKRSLTAQAVADAEGQVTRLGKLEPSDGPTTGPSAEEMQAVTDRMWDWYLEWSAIARHVIKDGRLLREMGFGTRKANAAAEEEDEDDEVAVPPAAPARTEPGKK